MRLPLVGLALLAALPLGAQDRVPTAADTVRANLAIARSDLRNLVVAQERYFSDHGRYAPHLDSMKALYVPSRGSAMVLTVARTDGWAAKLTRERLGGSCIIWVHVPESDRPKTSRDGLQGREGEPVCDPQPETQGTSGAATPSRPPRR